MDNQIKSPFIAPAITPEVLEMVKKMTGAISVFMIISDDDRNHVCTPEHCRGHTMNVNSIGFRHEEIMGLISEIAKKAGYKLVEDEDYED